MTTTVPRHLKRFPLEINLRRRLRRRLNNLPEATRTLHSCDTFGIWVRREDGLRCAVCGRP